ncbi:MAG: winged helix-turn-helix domain-containing protein [Candidatus Aminicenantes bacterium]|jgi:predicted transcriptional regulator
MDDNDWKLYSWVIRGNQRRKVIMALGKPKIPTEIKSEAKMSMTNVSKILKEFRSKGLVRCLTPGVRTGKLYELTEAGRKIREKMLEK